MSEAGQRWVAPFSGTIPARPWVGAHLSIFHLFFYSNLLLIWRVTPRHQIHDRSDGGDVRSRYPDVDCNARAVYGKSCRVLPKGARDTFLPKRAGPQVRRAQYRYDKVTPYVAGKPSQIHGRRARIRVWPAWGAAAPGS